MSLWRELRGGAADRSLSTVEDYALALGSFGFGGLNYPYSGGALPAVPQTMPGMQAEPIPNEFVGLARGALKANGVIFACMLVRMAVFSAPRFIFQRFNNGRPSELFGTTELRLLERPWQGGTTQDLLARVIQDADLAGNSYWTVEGGELVRLRPDWVQILLQPRLVRGLPDPDTGAPRSATLGWRRVGYVYFDDGPGSGQTPIFLLPNQVAHFAPIPDPEATYRGMSWLTPIIREVQADGLMTRHRMKFFEQAATPNLVVKHPPAATPQMIKQFRDVLDAGHAGVDKAYKNLHIGGGADVTVVGANLQQIEFKAVQGHGEPLALDTPIPTPSGWTTMGEVAVGDLVFGRDGLPARVVDVSPVHVGRPCYRVTFNDGTSVVADAGHVWTAIDRFTKARKETDYTTEQLAQMGREWAERGYGGNRFGVPRPAPIKGEARDLLVDPYVLGAWLGDGQTAGAAICGADEDLAFIAAEIESRGYTVTEWKTAEDKVSVIGLPGGLLAALRALGVLGDKHIPTDYLRASIEQRLDLLRGLMDTDGTIGHVGNETCEFSSKWQALAAQVAELARSLGYRTSVNVKRDARSRTGETWRVTFRADPEMVPFLLPRKAGRCVTPLWVRNRAVVSVEPVESVPVRCIAVDTADHLFLAGRGMVPTHNTRIAAAAGVPPVIVGLSEGLQAATYCLPADELVWTVGGPRPIAALSVGDQVWSHVDGGLAPRRVTWWGRTGEKQIFTVRTKNRSFRATDNHPVLVRVPGSMASGANADRHPTVEWRTVGELRPGDCVVQVMELPDAFAGTHTPTGEATPELMQWLGAYLGDGSGAGHPRGCISIAMPPADRAREHYEELTGRLFPEVNCAPQPRSFRFNSVQVAKWLADIGFAGRATTKRIPQWVFTLRRDLRLAFLAGLVDTDGSVDRRGSLKIQLANRYLVEQVKALAVSCGLQVSNLHEQTFKADVLPIAGRQATYVSWAVTVSSATDVAQIPFADPLYRQRVMDNYGRQRRGGKDAAKAGLDAALLGFFTVREIEPGPVVPVFDISVDQGQSFVAGGIVVHNSNYAQARRRLADGTMHPLWGNAAGSFETLVPAPGSPASRLWYDSRDVPFLREDSKDAAEIAETQARTIRTLVDGGYTPESVIKAVLSGDYGLLKHSGLYSVQLQAAGAQQVAVPAPAQATE